MNGREDELREAFEYKARLLTEKYTTEMDKLASIPKQIPKEQRMKNGKKIVKAVERKMADLSEQFRQMMDELTDNFIAAMAETEAG